MSEEHIERLWQRVMDGDEQAKAKLLAKVKAECKQEQYESTDGAQKEPQHTPGPWQALIDKAWIYIDAVPSLPENQRSTTQVAQLQARTPQMTQEEAEANARLIAAAPKMLDGLKQIDEYLTTGDQGAVNSICTRSKLHQHVRHLIDLATDNL